MKSMLKFFEDKHFDVVINCAASGGNLKEIDGWNVMVNNLTIFYNLIQCSNHFDKLFNLGSGAELYDMSKPYGLSKHIIRQTLLLLPKFYNVRIYGIFDENELDRRFIKTSIRNYINGDPMEIFVNKKMDFIYMPDFISIIKFYILNDNPPKEIDCTYSETKTLFDIANIINNLYDYNVDILITKEGQENYYGKYTPIDLNYIGLEQGIKNVFEKYLSKWK
jgi:nucleoside-diphosphate-sugar epimerase